MLGRCQSSFLYLQVNNLCRIPLLSFKCFNCLKHSNSPKGTKCIIVLHAENYNVFLEVIKTFKRLMWTLLLLVSLWAAYYCLAKQYVVQKTEINKPFIEKFFLKVSSFWSKFKRIQIKLGLSDLKLRRRLAIRSIVLKLGNRKQSMYRQILI